MANTDLRLHPSPSGADPGFCTGRGGGGLKRFCRVAQKKKICNTKLGVRERVVSPPDRSPFDPHLSIFNPILLDRSLVHMFICLYFTACGGSH